jgi:proteasome lid subunit RPN8/RPN11
VTERRLFLSDAMAETVLDAAARAHPAECCGLIEGTITPHGWRVMAIHETANMAEDPLRHFLIDPQVQFDLMRALRGSASSIIGCFHSHPDGAPQPSATDRANAFETDFLWLIAGGSPGSGLTLRAYHFAEETGFSSILIKAED